MTRWILVPALLLALGAFGARAHAQVFAAEGEATYEEEGVVYEDEGVVYEDEGVYQDEGVVYQEQQTTVFVDQNGQPVQQQQVEAQEPERLARQASVYGYVPIFLTNERDFVTPGIGLRARFGWEFGYVVPEVNFGMQIHFSQNDPDFPDVDSLQAFWFSLGARLQMLNASRFVPFVSAALHFTWWGRSEVGFDTVYAVDPGVGGAVGLALELTQNFGLEASVSALVNFPAQATFFDTQIILSPWVGGTLYF